MTRLKAFAANRIYTFGRHNGRLEWLREKSYGLFNQFERERERAQRRAVSFSTASPALHIESFINYAQTKRKGNYFFFTPSIHFAERYMAVMALNLKRLTDGSWAVGAEQHWIFHRRYRLAWLARLEALWSITFSSDLFSTGGDFLYPNL